MGYLKSMGTSIVWIGAFLAAITFLPGLPPVAEFSEYNIVWPKALTGKLGVNNRLNNAELLFKGQLLGPEDFAAWNGELYTGISGGYVVKVTDEQIIPIAKFGSDCDGVWQGEKCGRPLGMKFDGKGALYVCDVYHGIFKVDVKTGKYEKLVGRTPIEGKVPMFPNSLDIAKNGDVYWSDSTYNFQIQDGIYSMIENPAGRLIKYNAATKKNEVLVHNLGFANGVALSKNEDFVLAGETLTSRVIKYHLRGPKAGQKEILLEGLPGVPDNINKDRQGGFFVSLVNYADAENPLLYQSVIPHPYLRKMIARFLAVLELPFQQLQLYYPNYYFERILHCIGSFESMLFMTPPYVAILHLDENGKLVDAMYANDGKITGISSALIHKGYLYLGSPWADSIARVPLKQALPNWKENSQQKKAPVEKPVYENTMDNAPPPTPKPVVVTTTPKPPKKVPQSDKKPSQASEEKVKPVKKTESKKV